MDELYIDNLDEFIVDEGKIVTYKWLSLTLNVPCNTAKQMLFHYITQRKLDENIKLNVTYLVSGVTYDANLNQEVHKVCVVRDSSLNSVKEKFKCIFSVHVYSVQKAQLHDLNLLYAADYDKVKENVYEISRYSGITCPSIHRRSSDEIKTLKSKSAYKSLSPVKSNQTKTPLETRKVIDNENKENKFNVQKGLNDSEPKKSTCETKKNVVKGAKGALASMFANQSRKTEEKKAQNEISGANVKILKEEETSSKKGSLSAYFTKDAAKHQNHRKIFKTEVKDIPLVNVDFKSEDNKQNIHIDLEDDCLPSEVNSVSQDNKCNGNVLIKSKYNIEETKSFKTLAKNKEEKTLPPKSKTLSRSNKGVKKTIRKRKSDKEDPLANVKRRRIVAMVSSSESSSEENYEMDEDPLATPPCATIESDDDNDVILSTPQSTSIDVAEMAKGKKLKQVDKTYMDENGYFVTEKKYEYVSDCSDAENPMPLKNNSKSPKKQGSSPKRKVSSPKKKVTSPRKKRKSPKENKKSPVKTKQSSITSFFKRK